MYYFNSIIFNHIYSIKNKNNNNVKLYKMQVNNLDNLDSSWLSADAEVREIINGNPVFQQLPPPFYERDVVDALHQLTQRVNSSSTYEQIQLYLRDFDTRYGIIFRDDSGNRGLVFPEYIEHPGVRLGLEELEQAIAVKNSRAILQSNWEDITPQTLSSEIINKYSQYKPAYDKQMRDERQFGVDGSGRGRRGGNTRKKNIKRQKRYSQRRLRLRRKNKNKTHQRRRSRRMF